MILSLRKKVSKIAIASGRVWNARSLGDWAKAVSMIPKIDNNPLVGDFEKFISNSDVMPNFPTGGEDHGVIRNLGGVAFL